jgi:hypothetical protein
MHLLPDIHHRGDVLGENMMVERIHHAQLQHDPSGVELEATMSDRVNCKDCGKSLLDVCAERKVVFKSGAAKDNVLWLEPTFEWFCPEGQCRVKVTRGMR